MTPTAVSDAELLGQARGGDEAAFTELYVRHQAAARRLANAYARAGDPEDLVNESFERVLAALRHGSGPTESFRAYLFVTLRRLAADRISRSQDEPVEQVPEPVRAEQHTPPLDPADRQLVVTAYESLPERWQAVLWQTAVEGRQPRDLAPSLGMTANAAAALAYRAREKLRQAYLQAHLQAAPRPGCEPHRSRLGAYVRDGLSRRDRGATELHLDSCSSCRALVGELADVNRMLVRSLLPLFAAVGSHLAIGAAVTGTATVTGAGVGAGAAALARRVGRKARSNPTVIAGVVLVAALAFALIAAPGRDDDPVGQPEAPEDSSPSSPGGPAPASPDDAPPPDEPASPDDPADPDDPDDPDAPDEPMVPIVAVTPTIPGDPGDPPPAVPGAPPADPGPDPGPHPGPGEPEPPVTQPPPTSPPPTSPPPTQPPSTPYLLVVWVADVAELRITLHNPTVAPTAALVVEVELGGGAGSRGAPRGCGLLTTLLSGSTCGLQPVPPGASRTVSVPVDARGARPTAEVSLCQAQLLSLRCNGGLVGSVVALLV